MVDVPIPLVVTTLLDATLISNLCGKRRRADDPVEAERLVRMVISACRSKNENLDRIEARKRHRKIGRHRQHRSNSRNYKKCIESQVHESPE